jgi:hypothetical protein
MLGSYDENLSDGFVFNPAMLLTAERQPNPLAPPMAQEEMNAMQQSISN